MDRVLIFRSGALGDFLLTVPALLALRNAHPQARFTLITRPAYGALMQASGWIDDVQDIESARWVPLFSTAETLPAELAHWLASFDLIVAWMTDADDVFKNHLRSVPTIFHLLNPVINPAGAKAAEQLSEGLRSLLHPWPELPPPLLQLARSQHFTTLALHPGSGSPTKNWPLAHWITLLEMLSEWRPELRLLLITGPADAAIQAALSPRLHGCRNEITTAHDWPLAQLAAALVACTAYLGHDTGISHLAALCGVPTLWLFGPTDPAVWAPQWANVSILPSPTGTMSGITVAAVWSGLATMLDPFPRWQEGASETSIRA